MTTIETGPNGETYIKPDPEIKRFVIDENIRDGLLQVCDALLRHTGRQDLFAIAACVQALENAPQLNEDPKPQADTESR